MPPVRGWLRHGRVHACSPHGASADWRITEFCATDPRFAPDWISLTTATRIRALRSNAASSSGRVRLRTASGANLNG